MTAIDASRLRLPTWIRGPRADSRAEAVELTAAASVAQWMLAAIAGLALWFGGFGAGLSALQEQHAQHGLYAEFRSQLALGTAPLGASISEGAPVTLLQSPTGGLDGVVAVEGTSSADLRLGPGHFPGTPLPGQAGTSLLFGRSVSYGAPFGDITRLSAGDVIYATTGQGRFRYVVEDVRRAGDPVPPLPDGAGRLLLVTSEGTGWRSGWAPSRAVYVDALLQGKPKPGGSATATYRDADLPMHGDRSGLFALVLWLQLLLIGVVGIAVARVRWGIWQAWLIGLPIVLAALWGASSNAWLLLPNLV
jgi:sortase A